MSNGGSRVFVAAPDAARPHLSHQVTLNPLMLMLLVWRVVNGVSEWLRERAPGRKPSSSVGTRNVSA
jgi:hypothetical protein